VGGREGDMTGSQVDRRVRGYKGGRQSVPYGG
jgi:hypothetical protein